MGFFLPATSPSNMIPKQRPTRQDVAQVVGPAGISIEIRNAQSSGKRYVPPEKFKETVIKSHPDTIAATDHGPMAGEKAI